LHELEVTQVQHKQCVAQYEIQTTQHCARSAQQLAHYNEMQAVQVANSPIKAGRSRMTGKKLSRCPKYWTTLGGVGEHFSLDCFNGRAHINSFIFRPSQTLLGHEEKQFQHNKNVPTQTQWLRRPDTVAMHVIPQKKR